MKTSVLEWKYGEKRKNVSLPWSTTAREQPPVSRASRLRMGFPNRSVATQISLPNLFTDVGARIPSTTTFGPKLDHGEGVST